MLSRRDFLRNGGAAAVSLGLAPRLRAFGAGAAPPSGRPLLVVVFQRGGADGLNMVVPFTERAYYRARPSIAIAPPGRGAGTAIDLDGTFALHPALSAFEPLWHRRQLAIIHACGLPDRETADCGEPAQPRPFTSARSHLAAQEWMESLPRALHGAAPASTIAQLRAAATGRGPLCGADYPSSSFGEALWHVARLARADVGLEIACVDVGHWDHHVNAGGSTGQLASRLDDLGRSIAAFVRDMGDRIDETVVVTMSEFGRAVAENAAGGTDHGHGNVMFVIGGRVGGGRVYGRWPGLGPDMLHAGRDLAVTTDARSVFAEIARHHLGLRDTAGIFPGLEASTQGGTGALFSRT